MIAWQMGESSLMGEAILPFVRNTTTQVPFKPEFYTLKPPK